MKKMIIMSAAMLMLASCGTSQTITRQSVDSITGATARVAATDAGLSTVRAVSDGRLYAKNIVAQATLSVSYGDKDISVPGQLRMRRDEVIRLQAQIPLLGTEVGRLEFTPTYVLVVDRLHKCYIKEDYSQVDFLRDNGISFYSLQALFWNELFVPGKESVGESDLKKFSVADGKTITLVENLLSYAWKLTQDNKIGEANVVYADDSHGTSSLTWQYDDFRSVGVKLFPYKQQFTFSTEATDKKESATVNIGMSKVTTDDDWDALTTLSSKYTQVESSDLLSIFKDAF